MKQEPMFRKGDVVAVHPATDLFMQGVKIATVSRDYTPDSLPILAGYVRGVAIRSVMFKTHHKVHPLNLRKLD